MRYFLCLYIFVFSINSYSQEASAYKKLYNNIDNVPKDKQQVIGDSLFSNAKNDHEFVYAYFYKAHTEMYADDYNKSYSYLIKADSIIDIDINNFKKEKITALNMLNGIYKNLKMYSNFYDNIQKVNKILEEAPKEEYYTKVKGVNYLSLANYYSFIDDNKNALKEYKRAIDFLESHKFYTIGLVKAYNDLGMLYGELKQTDLSIDTYNKMNAINLKHVKSKHFEILYFLNVGVDFKISGDYKKSKEYLEKGIALANQYDIEFYKSSLNNQLAIIYDKLGKEPEADSLTTLQFQKTKEVLNNKLEANNQVTKKINEESKREIEKKTDSYNYLVAILIILILLGIVIFYLQHRRKEAIKVKFYKIIDEYKNSVKESNMEKVTFDQDSNIEGEIISKAKEKEIYECLVKFENEHKYLNKNMNLSQMAIELNTNSKYVSLILKKHRNCRFSNYLNSLRINYLVANLIENQEWRKYKIEYLAQLVGYSSHSRLAIVFKNEVGISPSDFINNLNKQNSSEVKKTG